MKDRLRSQKGRRRLLGAGEGFPHPTKRLVQRSRSKILYPTNFLLHTDSQPHPRLSTQKIGKSSRRVAVIFKGMFVLKLKATCRRSTIRKKREKLGQKHNFRTRLISRLELKKADYSTCANKEKLMTDIDADKLALMSDCPFLMCVFTFLPMKCYLYDNQDSFRPV